MSNGSVYIRNWYIRIIRPVLNGLIRFHLVFRPFPGFQYPRNIMKHHQDSNNWTCKCSIWPMRCTCIYIVKVHWPLSTFACKCDMYMVVLVCILLINNQWCHYIQNRFGLAHRGHGQINFRLPLKLVSIFNNWSVWNWPGGYIANLNTE